MALTVVDQFYSSSDAETSSGSRRLAPVADVTGTYVQFGLSELNNLALVTRTIPWTGSDASSSGDVVDDKIIVEFGCYFFDTHLSTVMFDPETGAPMNRHWQTAMQILLSKYGVMGENGELVAPKYALEEKASDTANRVDASSDDASSGTPDL